MMKVLLQIGVWLLLLGSLLGKALQVTAGNSLTCNDRQYKLDTLEKCCSRCRPGTYAKKECTETADTQCQPCEDGKYTSSWNYALKCQSCKSCDPPLVEKEKCSSTKKELCVCPEGHECVQYNGIGICNRCMPIPSPTTPSPITPSPTAAALPPEPNVMQITSTNAWIFRFITVVVVITIIAILIILYVRHNTAILKKLGCMAKVKKPQPESTGLEVTVQPPVDQRLLAESNLRYPIEETSATQSAEYALNSPHRHPI